MSQDLIYQVIVRQISDVYGVTQLDKKMSINSLNAVSEENEEFLKRFEKEFGVNMQGFNYYDFFYEDQLYSIAMINLVIRLFGSKRKKQLLTIEHLMKVAENKKWFPPF